jgi:hypothetical protein
MKLQLFYHVAQMGNWREVVTEQIKLFAWVGLRPMTGVLGAESIDGIDLGDILFHRDELADCEAATMQEMWKWCCEHQDDAVLYCHTKGVSEPSRRRTLWRQLMNKVVVERWRENIALLAEFDAVGFCYRTSATPHFAGNFFLARADWIASLPSIYAYREFGSHTPEPKKQPWRKAVGERWYFSRPGARIKSLCCSGQKPFRVPLRWFREQLAIVS